MQNIQDLKDKVFSESRNIIDILSKTNNIDDLIAKQNLLDDLAEKVTFLRLLDKNFKIYGGEISSQSYNFSNDNKDSDDFVIEEEAIFNNQLNEIEGSYQNFENNLVEEEAIFNNQLNEIVETEFHENSISLAEENQPEADENFISDEISDHFQLEEEAVFNNELNEINEKEDNALNTPEIEVSNINPTIFGFNTLENNVLVEEENTGFIENELNKNQEEIISDSSNIETILSEIKKDFDSEYELDQPDIVNENSEKTIHTNLENNEILNDCDDKNSEENDCLSQEKKIKLAHIKSLKSVQSLFDDDLLEPINPVEKVEIQTVKEDTGNLIKTNISTDFIEQEKPRPEFRLDLNDRLAFTKILFGGSQTDLNNAISDLNQCISLEEAKEYLSDMYYEKNWDKVDEYAQRLWMLVENKFM